MDVEIGSVVDISVMENSGIDNLEVMEAGDIVERELNISPEEYGPTEGGSTLISSVLNSPMAIISQSSKGSLANSALRIAKKKSIPPKTFQRRGSPIHKRRKVLKKKRFGPSLSSLRNKSSTRISGSSQSSSIAEMYRSRDLFTPSPPEIVRVLNPAVQNEDNGSNSSPEQRNEPRVRIPMINPRPMKIIPVKKKIVGNPRKKSSASDNMKKLVGNQPTKNISKPPPASRKKRQSKLQIESSSPLLKRYRHIGQEQSILNEIRMVQTSTRLLIPRHSFYRLVRELTKKVTDNETNNTLKFQSSALQALHEATEQYIVGVLEDSYMITLHAKRKTLTDKDIQIQSKICKVSLMN